VLGKAATLGCLPSNTSISTRNRLLRLFLKSSILRPSSRSFFTYGMDPPTEDIYLGHNREGIRNAADSGYVIHYETGRPPFVDSVDTVLGHGLDLQLEGGSQGMGVFHVSVASEVISTKPFVLIKPVPRTFILSESIMLPVQGEQSNVLYDIYFVGEDGLPAQFFWRANLTAFPLAKNEYAVVSNVRGASTGHWTYFGRFELAKFRGCIGYDRQYRCNALRPVLSKLEWKTNALAHVVPSPIVTGGIADAVSLLQESKNVIILQFDGGNFHLLAQLIEIRDRLQDTWDAFEGSMLPRIVMVDRRYSNLLPLAGSSCFEQHRISYHCCEFSLLYLTEDPDSLQALRSSDFVTVRSVEYLPVGVAAVSAERPILAGNFEFSSGFACKEVPGRIASVSILSAPVALALAAQDDVVDVFRSVGLLCALEELAQWLKFGLSCSWRVMISAALPTIAFSLGLFLFLFRYVFPSLLSLAVGHTQTLRFWLEPTIEI